MRVEFSQLPEDLRVRLTEKGREELWHRVDEFGGVKTLSESFNFSQSKMYNWKNKELALPVNFVKRLMGENSTRYVQELKGKRTSGAIKEPEFPLHFPDELLTRINASVKVNAEGTPIYIARERSLVDRFQELLDRLGKVDYRVYSRSSRYELRYPKFLHRIASRIEYETDTAALIDEKGVIEEGEIILPEKTLQVEEFSGELYSREKSFELALQRGDSKKIAELMAEESSKVRKMIE